MNSEMTKVVTLHVNDVLPNRFQPRIRFNEEKINELADSIKKYGVIQPITVRRIGDKYEIIAGERRYKATVLAGLTEIPAIINNLNDKDSSEVALIENVQREDLTPIEEAISYKKILDMGDLTQENLAERLGMSQSTVANKLRLLHLTEEVQDALLENKISERHARSLLRIHDTKKQVQMLQRIVEGRLTVRKTDDEIKIVLEGHNPSKKTGKINEDIENKNNGFDETEILDLINTLEKINMEDKEMNNNDPINQFDIPEVNIVDDIPSTTREVVEQKIVPVNPVSIMPVQSLEPQEIKIEEPNTPKMDNSTNPGFMDIDKIEREATDISPKEKKAEDHSFLLKNPIQVDPQSVEKNIPQKEPLGRFFDVMPSIHSDRTEEQNGAAPMVPERMEGSIFSDTSSIFSNLEPVVVPVGPMPSTPVENILENPTIEPVKEVAKQDIPKAEEQLVIEPIMEIPPTMDSPTVSVEPIIEPLEESWTQPIPVQTPISVEPISEPIVNSIIPVIESVETVHMVEPGFVPNANPFEAPIVPLVPQSMIGESIPASVTSISRAIEEEEKTKREIHPLSMKTREGISTVRSAVHQLESLGLKVDIEEVDLAGTYQIIIKIEK